MRRLNDTKSSTRKIIAQDFKLNVALYTTIKAKSIDDAKVELERAIKTFTIRNEKVKLDSYEVIDEEGNILLSDGMPEQAETIKDENKSETEIENNEVSNDI